jgi:hypothetical protein
LHPSAHHKSNLALKYASLNLDIYFCKHTHQSIKEGYLFVCHLGIFQTMRSSFINFKVYTYSAWVIEWWSSCNWNFNKLEPKKLEKLRRIIKIMLRI